MFFILLFTGCFVQAQEAVFKSPITEYVDVPSDGMSLKNIDREIILKENEIVLKTSRPEGDTDIEIWTKADYDIHITRHKGRVVRSFNTFLIFNREKILAKWDFVDDGDGKIELISRTLFDSFGDNPLTSRFQID